MKNAIWLFIIALLILLVFVPSYTAMQDKKAVIEKYEMQTQALEEEIKSLKVERTLLEDDPEYLEGVAREKMGVAREGEVIYRIEMNEE